MLPPPRDFCRPSCKLSLAPDFSLHRFSPALPLGMSAVFNSLRIHEFYLGLFVYSYSSVTTNQRALEREISQPIKLGYVTEYICARFATAAVFLWKSKSLFFYKVLLVSNMSQELKRSTSVGDKRQWIRPDLPSKCTWHLGIDVSESPHQHKKSENNK